MGWTIEGLDEIVPLPPCPRCGGMGIVPVVFGLPGPDLVEEARRGKVVLGGCMPLPNVIGACEACGEWRRRGEETGPKPGGLARR